MRWFIEEAEAGRMNEVLSKVGRGFAGAVFGKREELVEGGLDEELFPKTGPVFMSGLNLLTPPQGPQG